MLGLSLGGGHEFDTCQRQGIAQLGGVDEIRGEQSPFDPCSPVAHRDALDPVALHFGTNRLVLEQRQQAAARCVGCEQGCQGRERNFRLMAKPRNTAVSRVEMAVLTSSLVQRVMAPVISCPDVLSQPAVRIIRPELLDPGVLVGRNALRGELTTDPVSRLDHNGGATGPQGRKRRRTAAQATADDGDVGGDLSPIEGFRENTPDGVPDTAPNNAASPQPDPSRNCGRRSIDVNLLATNLLWRIILDRPVGARSDCNTDNREWRVRSRESGKRAALPLHCSVSVLYPVIVRFLSSSPSHGLVAEWQTRRS